LLSNFHIGLVQGYLDDQRSGLAEAVNAANSAKTDETIPHPVQAINNLLAELDKNAETWLA
jgi:hypothetical protein